MGVAVLRYHLGIDLRRRWFAMLALTVLVAAVGGIVVASIAGARRTGTAYDRLLAVSNPAHGMAFGDAETLEGLRALPEVEDLGVVTLFATTPRDDVTEAFLPMMASVDGRVPRDLNRVQLVAGRLPDPGAPHELAMREKTAQQLGLEVGDQLAMQSFTPAEARALEESQGEAPEPTGPQFSFDIVGITRDASDVVARESDLATHWLTPAFARRYGAVMGTWGTGAFVVRTDEVSAEQLVGAIHRHAPDLVLEDLDTGAGSFNASLRLMADGLLMFAGVLAAAGLVAVAQMFIRDATGRGDETRALAALGLGVRLRALLMAGPGVVAAVIGGLGTVLISIGLSVRFPIGLARRAEPDPGIDVDVAAVLGGAVAVTAAVAILAVGAAWLAVRSHPARLRPAPRIRSAVRPRPLSPALAAGTSLASARTASNLPIRSTRSAVAAGALGVTAALVFASSLSHLLSTPRLYGWTFDAGVDGTENDPDRLVEGADLEADPSVAEIAPVLFQIQLSIEGQPTFGAAIGHGGAGRIGPVVAEGRAPVRADELAVGASTLGQIDRNIGDEVRVDAGHGPATFEIVGRAVLPVSGDGNTRVGSGVSMTLAAAERLGIDPSQRCVDDQTCYGQTAVRWVEGADVDAAAGRLLEAGELSEFAVPRPPAEVERLADVESVPWVLAGALGVLGAGAIAHTVWLTVKRRQHHLGILRTLGFSRRQLVAAVSVQSAALVVVAAVVGSVAGTAAGRALWDLVATDVGVVRQPVVPHSATMLVPVVAVVLSQAIALAPARHVGRMRPATILRAE